MHYLITGHTGFKGAWLTLMLTQQGHQVSGLSLDPEPGSLYVVGAVGELVQQDIRGDIRSAGTVRTALEATSPDAVYHLAAQPLVRESYLDPRTTIETNVMGTYNVIEAISTVPSIKASVIITTDKVYRNVNQIQGYIESDPLGGHDPYSASKAMADILTQSWMLSFPGSPMAIARAGNVIGGGDVCRDRLMPDLMRGFSEGTEVSLRYPEAVRPWQHVLDCLTGYQLLMQELLAHNPKVLGQPTWNFGPGPKNLRTVGEVADLASQMWGSPASWSVPAQTHPHEAELLALDATPARQKLAWADRLDFGQAIEWTVEWTKSVNAGTDPRATTTAQIKKYVSLVNQ
ncbi:CDP-glucose 4,6-dehydratase [Arsukibacterium sp.]|uniref:CDP-glucose 4,6-dehydratase n=1 Tax=Arsukibacterium sp. TaxID=1977258 RepID=UPI001BD3C01A|nr:CDP-glucose 4,6-dehydratase [Arsukibacterium sp.]